MCVSEIKDEKRDYRKSTGNKKHGRGKEVGRG
jgi:hypothetical protein